MILDVLAALAPVVCVLVGLIYMWRILKQIKPILRRLDELKKWEDRIAQWERDRAMWETGTYVKLEPKRSGQPIGEDEELPF